MYTLKHTQAKNTRRETLKNFRVELKKVVDDSYDVEIGRNLIPQLIKDIKKGLTGNIKKFAVITDSTVERLYATPILVELHRSGFKSDIFVFPAGEKSKVRKTKEELEDAMLAKGYRRDCCVIAVGGGVVTDLAGFLAGTYGRGIPFINFATTHLAAADASIGGKTAVDTDLATNLIGLIYQPLKVYVDISTWKTLPREQMINGMAETIKHACLADEKFFAYLEKHVDEILNVDEDVCEYISEMNCQIKYQVVMKDEKEQNLREILNLGHTVGRAIETVSDYRLLHGQAVSIGLVAQAELGMKLGFLSAGQKDRICKLLEKAGLPVSIPEYIDKEALVRKLYTDKKVRNGKLRMVFMDGIGKIRTFGKDVYARETAENEIRDVIMKL